MSSFDRHHNTKFADTWSRTDCDTFSMVKTHITSFKIREGIRENATPVERTNLNTDHVIEDLICVMCHLVTQNVKHEK